MANLKKRRHSAICNDCNGNGYKQCFIDTDKDMMGTIAEEYDEGREHVIVQCTTCHSEGEIYVDESEIIEPYIDADFVTGDVSKLH